MTDISTLSQRLATPTLTFVLLTIATCGIWPLLWLYRKQQIISDTTGYPVCGDTFVIWLAVCFGLGRQFGVMASLRHGQRHATGLKRHSVTRLWRDVHRLGV